MTKQVDNTNKNQVTIDGMTYINLIGHEINDTDSGLRIPGSRGYVARLDYDTELDEQIGMISVNKTVINRVKNLPEPKAKTLYIVSALTMKGIPEERKDVVCPGPVLKDRTKNEVIGCQGFRRNE